jgi:hypothetical protein
MYLLTKNVPKTCPIYIMEVFPENKKTPVFLVLGNIIKNTGIF